MIFSKVGVQTRETLLVAGPALIILVAAFWFALQFVEPAPPKIVKMTSGSETGAYYKFGRDYAQELAQSGITLDVMTSAGSIENKKRLLDEKSDFQVGLMQGGLGDDRSRKELVSLGRVFLEPLWVFYRGTQEINQLVQLTGQRIAVGKLGSGTRLLAEALLQKNGVNSSTATYVELGGSGAVSALSKGEVDAAFLTLAPEAEDVQTLLRMDGVRLMNFMRGEAYTRLFPYLSVVTLPRGAIDMVRDLPPSDVTLVAPKAALVARRDLHPALAGILVQAAQEVHGGGGMFNRIGEFPKPIDPEYELSSDAKRMYSSGPPFLRRFLPFWLATFLERMFVMVVPIATIMLPLFKIVPMVYEWRIRSRIMHWYAQLKTLEKDMAADGAGERHQEHVSEIQRIDEAVGLIPVPLHYSDRFYELKAAVDLVRQRILGRVRPV